MSSETKEIKEQALIDTCKLGLEETTPLIPMLRVDDRGRFRLSPRHASCLFRPAFEVLPSWSSLILPGVPGSYPSPYFAGRRPVLPNANTGGQARERVSRRSLVSPKRTLWSRGAH